MEVIITMAGLGTRFSRVGYRVPKYEVSVRGRSLFSWSVSSLTQFIHTGARFVFITLEQSEARRFIAEECEALSLRNYDVVEIERPTNGQATTALAAAARLSTENTPIVIYNIDTYVEHEYLSPVEMEEGDGWIPCFLGEGESWSFVQLGEHGQAIEVREKKRISPYATIGLYAFSSFALFRQTSEEYFRGSENAGGGERYIAPIYNHLIARRRKVHVSLVPLHAVHPLGTPEDVERFGGQ